MDSLEMARQIIDYWVNTQYDGDPNAAATEDEMGDFNDLALEVIEVIDEKGLRADDGIAFNASQVELELF